MTVTNAHPVFVKAPSAAASSLVRDEAVTSEFASSVDCVPMRTIMASMRVVFTIMAMAAVAAITIASIALGPKLVFLGAMVAFAMILFIGMPLLLASLGDVMEQEPSHS